MKRLSLCLCLALCFAAADAAKSAIVSYSAPVLDKWVYSNVPGSVGGTRETAPVFATLNSADEDRLGTFLMVFKTSPSAPSGLGPESYVITSARLTVFTAAQDTFVYDPTYDPWRSYLQPSAPEYAADADVGRPLELYGAGLRNGFTEFSASVSGALPHQFHENSPHGPASVNMKNAYPLAFDSGGAPVDVSDNVSQAFDPAPFAIGRSDALSPGDFVPIETEFRFDLDVASPHVQSYIKESLNRGMLGLFIATLHAAQGQGGAQTYPIFFTKDNLLGSDLNPQLEIEYTIIPEPRAATLLILAAALWAGSRAWRNRQHFS
jgi:hypothetical protein